MVNLVKDIVVSEFDKAELKELIKEAVKELHQNEALPGVTTQDMIENHIWIKQQRERSSKLSTIFFTTVITTVTGGALTALFYGIKTMMGK